MVLSAHVSSAMVPVWAKDCVDIHPARMNARMLVRKYPRWMFGLTENDVTYLFQNCSSPTFFLVKTQEPVVPSLRLMSKLMDQSLAEVSNPKSTE